MLIITAYLFMESESIKSGTNYIASMTELTKQVENCCQHRDKIARVLKLNRGTYQTSTVDRKLIETISRWLVISK